MGSLSKYFCNILFNGLLPSLLLGHSFINSSGIDDIFPMTVNKIG